MNKISLCSKNYSNENFAIVLFTGKPLLSRMHGLMSLEIGAGFEFQIAFITSVGTIVGVDNGQVSS